MASGWHALRRPRRFPIPTPVLTGSGSKGLAGCAISGGRHPLGATTLDRLGFDVQSVYRVVGGIDIYKMSTLIETIAQTELQPIPSAFIVREVQS